MPDKQDADQKVDMSAVKTFKRNSLKHTTTKESTNLPTQAAIDQEKQAMEKSS